MRQILETLQFTKNFENFKRRCTRRDSRMCILYLMKNLLPLLQICKLFMYAIKENIVTETVFYSKCYYLFAYIHASSWLCALSSPACISRAVHVFQFEKQCAEYSFQVEQLSDRLEESGGSSSLQVTHARGHLTSTTQLLIFKCISF